MYIKYNMQICVIKSKKKICVVVKVNVSLFLFLNSTKKKLELQIKNRTSLLYQRNIFVFCSIQNCSSFGIANLLIPLLLACFFIISYHIILCFFITLWSFISIWLSA